MPHLDFECQFPCFRRKLRVGLEYVDIPMLFGYMCLQLYAFFCDRVESWCLTVPNLC